MAEIMVYIWLGVVVLSLVGEAATMDMTSIWFSLGGVLAIIAWFIWNTGTGSIILQVLLFIGVSLICILTLRPVCKKVLLKNDNEKTNVSAFAGSCLNLLTDITTEQKGTVKINDVTWACISDNGEELKAGTAVEIVRVSGNKLIVHKVQGVIEEKPKVVSKAKHTTKKTTQLKTSTKPKAAPKPKKLTEQSTKKSTQTSKSTRSTKTKKSTFKNEDLL